MKNIKYILLFLINILFLSMCNNNLKSEEKNYIFKHWEGNLDINTERCKTQKIQDGINYSVEESVFQTFVENNKKIKAFNQEKNSTIQTEYTKEVIIPKTAFDSLDEETKNQFLMCIERPLYPKEEPFYPEKNMQHLNKCLFILPNKTNKEIKKIINEKGSLQKKYSISHKDIKNLYCVFAEYGDNDLIIHINFNKLERV